jgi:hypothetical protein
MHYYFLHQAEEDKTTLHFEQQLLEERIKKYEEQQRLLANWRNAKNELDQVKVSATSVQPSVQYCPSYYL